MEDLRLNFGACALSSSAASYCETVLDFEEDPTILSSSVPVKVRFTATAAVTAFEPAVYTGTTATPTTAHTLASAVALAVGESVEYPLPFFEATRYMRAGGKGSGNVVACLVVGHCVQ